MMDSIDKMARVEREIERSARAAGVGLPEREARTPKGPQGAGRMEAACEKDGWYVAVAMMPPESTTLHIEKFGEEPVAGDDAQAALDSAVAFAKAEFGTGVTVERFDEKIPIFGCYVMPLLQHDTHPMNYMPFLFGIPFLVASIFIWYGILLMLFGTRRLVLEHGSGSYSAKLWGIGRTRRFELRPDTEITDSRLEKKPNIQIHMPTASNPFVRKIRIKNGYRSETVCAFWDDDSIEFAMSLLKRRAG